MRSTLFSISKRKLVTLFLAALLGMVSISEAKDSTWLQSESVMTAKIGRSSSIIPLGTIVAWPHTGNMPSSLATDDWCECDGRAIPSDADIVKKLGITRTPNLYAGMGTAGKGYFLRAGETPRQVSADKFESHLHGQPEHTHAVDGRLVSTAITSNLVSSRVSGNLDDTAVSGTAAPQSYTYYTASAGGSSQDFIYRLYIWDASVNFYFDGIRNDTRTGHTSGGSVTGNVTNSKVTSKVDNTRATGTVTNGAITGTAHEAGGDNTYNTGEDETAPTYYTTRYFMRINE